MNIFGLDIEQLDLDAAKAALTESPIERLPAAPAFLSRKECAAILGVSIKVVNKLIETGHLPLVKIPNDNSPVCCDLFGQPMAPPPIECILRADLVDFLEKSLLCHKPILAPEEVR